MRLKSYNAPSMAEAMRMIRQELGDDAIIVSTQRAPGGKGVRITAALESIDSENFISEILTKSRHAPTSDSVRLALENHGVPSRLLEKLINFVNSSGMEDALSACSAALSAGFVFAPLPDNIAPRPFILAGPHGSGKTMTIAKLAARSVMKNRRVGVISSDNIRAGANAQLAAFTNILKIELQSVRGPESLKNAISEVQANNDIVFIDSPGLNPFRQSDMDYLKSLVEVADIEPILVFAAGSDAHEAAEIGEAFGNIGVTRLLATRLDSTRRLGSILAAADAGQMMFCDVCTTPRIVNGINPVSPMVMANLLLQETPDAEIDSQDFMEASHK